MFPAFWKIPNNTINLSQGVYFVKNVRNQGFWKKGKISRVIGIILNCQEKVRDFNVVSDFFSTLEIDNPRISNFSLLDLAMAGPPNLYVHVNKWLDNDQIELKWDYHCTLFIKGFDHSVFFSNMPRTK